VSGASHDPWKDAQRFGQVLVVVDTENDGAMVQAPQPGPVHDLMRTMRLHGLDEITGAYQVQSGMASTDPVAANIARALKFAAAQLKAHRGSK